VVCAGQAGRGDRAGQHPHFARAALRDAIDLVQSRLVITDASLNAALAEVLPELPRINQDGRGQVDAASATHGNWPPETAVRRAA